MKTENTDTAPTTMAGSKFATMVTRNTRKVLVILAYMFLEWVLIILLLCNSCFSYLIRKFAAYFGLKPPCLWCSSRADHFLEPAKSADPYKSLVCENHGSEISRLTYCSNHRRLAESENMCEECFASQPKYPENSAKYSPETCRCSCCEKTSEIKEIEEKDGVIVREGKVIEGDNNSGSECEHQVLSDVGSFYLREAAEDSNEDEETACANIGREAKEGIRRIENNEVAVKQLQKHAGGKQIENGTKEEEAFLVERVDNLLLSADNRALIAEESLHGNHASQTECEHDASFKIQRLKSDLETESKARNDLYVELEAERSAAAIAANQTMAMITRLQEEKAAMQMEALQYQRVMEEQAEYDQEALQLLNELVLKREREKQEVEEELDLYRVRVSDYEAKEKAMTLIQKCDNNSVDSDSDVLSIDLNRQYNKHDEDGKISLSSPENENIKEISLLDCSKEWGAIEDSLEELEKERLAIMKQLKDLDEKLYQSEKEEEIEPTSELCSQEVNLVSSSFSTHVTISEDQPKTMTSVARKLLDLVESDLDGGETDQDEAALTSSNQVGTRSKRLAIEKEMDHVYGRLQALEADTEFLRHCIGSVNKGNTGLNLLQEILQHLRELRAAEIFL